MSIYLSIDGLMKDLTGGEHDEETEVARAGTLPRGDEQQVGLEAVVVLCEPIQRISRVLPYRVIQHLH